MAFDLKKMLDTLAAIDGLIPPVFLNQTVGFRFAVAHTRGLVTIGELLASEELAKVMAELARDKGK